MPSAEVVDQLRAQAKALEPEDPFHKEGWLIPSDRRYQCLADSIKGQSGGYLGIGSYQNFHLIGQMQATDLAVIIDRTAEVTSAISTLVRVQREHPSLQEIIKAVSDFDNLPFSLANATNSWLQDPSARERIHQLAVQDRLWVVRADLVDPKLYPFLQTLFAAYQTELAVTYLTNVEEHLQYEDGVGKADPLNLFWKNLAELPLSPQGVILRSYHPNLDNDAMVRNPDNDQFCYATQGVEGLKKSPPQYPDYWDLKDDLQRRLALSGSPHIDLRLKDVYPIYSQHGSFRPKAAWIPHSQQGSL